MTREDQSATKWRIWALRRRAMISAALIVLVVTTSCAGGPGSPADANAQLNKIYLEAVATLRQAEDRGADQAVMNRLELLRKELRAVDVGDDACLADKQVQVAQTVGVVTVAATAIALHRRSPVTRKLADLAHMVITRTSDPDNQPKRTDVCYGKGLPEVFIGGESI